MDFHKPDPPAEVRSADAEIVSAVKAAIKQADKSSWEVADGYLELSKRGWTGRRIAREFGVSESSVSSFLTCARKFALTQTRPSFWEAYRGVDGHSGDGDGDVAKPAPEEPITVSPERQLRQSRIEQGKRFKVLCDDLAKTVMKALKLKDKEVRRCELYSAADRLTELADTMRDFAANYGDDEPQDRHEPA
jgi:hypothetical protein